MALQGGVAYAAPENQIAGTRKRWLLAHFARVPSYTSFSLDSPLTSLFTIFTPLILLPCGGSLSEVPEGAKCSQSDPGQERELKNLVLWHNQQVPALLTGVRSSEAATGLTCVSLASAARQPLRAELALPLAT